MHERSVVFGIVVSLAGSVVALPELPAQRLKSTIVIKPYESTYQTFCTSNGQIMVVHSGPSPAINSGYRITATQLVGSDTYQLGEGSRLIKPGCYRHEFAVGTSAWGNAFAQSTVWYDAPRESTTGSNSSTQTNDAAQRAEQERARAQQLEAQQQQQSAAAAAREKELREREATLRAGQERLRAAEEARRQEQLRAATQRAEQERRRAQQEEYQRQEQLRSAAIGAEQERLRARQQEVLRQQQEVQERQARAREVTREDANRRLSALRAKQDEDMRQAVQSIRAKDASDATDASKRLQSSMQEDAEILERANDADRGLTDPEAARASIAAAIANLYDRKDQIRKDGSKLSSSAYSIGSALMGAATILTSKNSSDASATERQRQADRKSAFDELGKLNELRQSRIDETIQMLEERQKEWIRATFDAPVDPPRSATINVPTSPPPPPTTTTIPSTQMFDRAPTTSIRQEASTPATAPENDTKTVESTSDVPVRRNAPSHLLAAGISYDAPKYGSSGDNSAHISGHALLHLSHSAIGVLGVGGSGSGDGYKSQLANVALSIALLRSGRVRFDILGGATYYTEQSLTGGMDADVATGAMGGAMFTVPLLGPFRGTILGSYNMAKWSDSSVWHTGDAKFLRVVFGLGF